MIDNQTPVPVEPLPLTKQEEDVKWILESKYFRLNPRRSKYNAHLWWEYRDGPVKHVGNGHYVATGDLVRDANGNLMQNYRQLAFLQYEGPECFFGGSTGGGKSSAVAIDVLRYFDVPNFAALIMRRTWMELSEGAESMIQFLKEKLEPFMVGKNAPVT